MSSRRPEDGLEGRFSSEKFSFWIWLNGQGGIAALAILLLGLVALLAVWGVTHH